MKTSWAQFLNQKVEPPAFFTPQDLTAEIGDIDNLKGHSTQDSHTFYPDGTYCRYYRRCDENDVTEIYRVGVYTVSCTSQDAVTLHVTSAPVAFQDFGCPDALVDSKHMKTFQVPYDPIGKEIVVDMQVLFDWTTPVEREHFITMRRSDGEHNRHPQHHRNQQLYVLRHPSTTGSAATALFTST
eukprot:PhF_6_TR43647/c0_g1_i1/m.67069